MDTSELVTKKDLAEAVEQLTELIRDVETQLLTAFHGYGNLETRRGPGSH